MKLLNITWQEMRVTWNASSTWFPWQLNSCDLSNCA